MGKSSVIDMLKKGKGPEPESDEEGGTAMEAPSEEEFADDPVDEAVTADVSQEVSVEEGVSTPETYELLAAMTVKDMNALVAQMGITDQEKKEIRALNKKDKTAMLATLFGLSPAPLEAVTSGHIDELDQIAHEMEAIKSETEAVKTLRGLVEAQSESSFKIGALLTVINDKSWFLGHETLKDFLKEEFGWEYRKGRYMISLYEGFLENGVSYKIIDQIGWTKAVELLPVITNENEEEWLEKAKANNIHTLKALVKAAKDGSHSGDGEGPVVSEVTTKTFKFHEDQMEVIDTALEKAMAESNTDVPSVAMEYIAGAYLSESPHAKPAEEKDTTKYPDDISGDAKPYYREITKQVGAGQTHEDVLAAFFEAFDFHFPKVDIEIDIK